MSHFDEQSGVSSGGNPFDDQSKANPYAASHSGGGSFFSKVTSLGKSTFSAADADSTVAPRPQDLERKEKELRDLEMSLKRKEEELSQQEARAGVEVKNFPMFWPLIHHDIRNDIPDGRKAIQYAAFWSWMGIMMCLTVNFIGAIASWIAGTFEFFTGVANFFLALIYLLCGVPLSYFLWYKPLYRAMKASGFISFTMFFIDYTIHIAFCIFAAIAPPFLWHGYSFTGWMAGISILGNGWTAVGIIYLIGAAVWSAETCLSIYVIGRVFAHWRGRA